MQNWYTELSESIVTPALFQTVEACRSSEIENIMQGCQDFRATLYIAVELISELTYLFVGQVKWYQKKMKLGFENFYN